MKLKTIAALFVMLLLAFNFEGADASSFKEVKVITSSSIEVYEKPDASSKVVGTVTEGTLVTQISKGHNGTFSRISYLNKDGKIVDGYIADIALDDALYGIQIASSKSGLVVKQTPSLNGKTVATLQHKMVVKDFGSVGNGWSLVQYGNVIGYATTSFMSESKPTTKYVVTQGLVVRNIASPSGDNIGELSKNEEVLVHSTIAGWSFVTTPLYGGYVIDSHLTSKNPSANTSNGSSSSSKPSNGSKSKYKNCTELRKDHPNGVGSDHPAYEKKHDRDGDGWACER